MLDHSLFWHLNFSVASLGLIFAFVYFNRRRRRRVYLIDFMCFKAPEDLRVPISSFFEHADCMDNMDRGTLEFQKKVIERSGIGNETYLPYGVHLLPPDHSYNGSMAEAKLVLFSVVQNLLTKRTISPESIDILITNCSINCPTPSLAAMIMNEFGFRSNIMSFNLSGMGCSAGILSIAMAKDLLKVHENSVALVVSTELVCSGAYKGKLKSMLLSNCLFRMGAAAVLLSNRKWDERKAKYELRHIVRTHLGAKDSAYSCIIQKTDDQGHNGVSLSRSIVHVASEALKINMGSLGYLVLPYSEQVRYAASVMWSRVWPWMRKDPEVPDFKKVINHFCVHAGGKAVIDSIREHLRLTEEDVEASKMTLYRFGNTSSSSTWYCLCYLEAKEKVKKGDTVWQLAFGSGFKCNSAVWKCISKMSADKLNAWGDRIHRYPVTVPEVAEH